MKPIFRNTITIHQVLRLSFLFLFLGGIVWYMLFQARLLLAGPEIALLNEPNAVQSDQTVLLDGVAKNITELSLNGKPIFTDKEGYFRQALVLERGYTIMTLDAKDRYGRTTSLSRSFVHTPEETIN